MSQPYSFHSIPVIVNKYVDIIQFEALVDMEELKNTLKLQSETKFERQDHINALNTRLNDINKLLSLTQKAIDMVIKYETHKLGDMRWLYNGGKEIITIYKICGILEFNIADILKLLDSELYHENDLKGVLDTFNLLLEMNLQLKRNIYELQSKLEVANQYHEINECVLKSLKDELLSLKQKFECISEYPLDFDIEKKIKKLSFKEIRSKIRESDMMTNCHSEVKFIMLNPTDKMIFNVFIETNERFKHLVAAMRYIPNSIEMFLNNAKSYYPNEILVFVDNYSNMLKEIASIKEKLSRFHDEIIISRLNSVFSVIMDMVDHCTVSKDIKEMVSMLEILKNICDLDFEERQKYSMLRSRYVDNATLVDSLKVDITRRRVFSNPISETLKLKPSLSTDNEQFCLFETELNLMENIRAELNASINCMNNSILGEITNTISSGSMLTPKSDSAFSVTSSPDNLKVKDIFDSPDPFVTPTSKKNRKSRIPVKTPNTTPNTSKFIALPTSTGPRQNTSSNSSIIDTPPLLDFSSSKLISVTKASPLSSSTSPALNIYTPPPKIQQTATYRSPRSATRPSLIPLPVRHESRLDIMRATSKQDRKHDFEFIENSVHELEQRANNLQVKAEAPKSIGNGQVVISKVRSNLVRNGYFSSKPVKYRISTL